MKLNFEMIDYLRKKNGLSIMGLCQLAGISRTTLWKWQNKKLVPSEKLARKMANVLNASLSEISDTKESTQISQKSLSDVVDSWLTLTDLNTKGHQEEISGVLDSIKNLNNKLNQSVVIIKALLDTMETMFYIKDSKLKYLTANVSFLNNTSYDPAETVLGKDDFVFFSQEEARRNTKEDKNVLMSGQAILREERPLPGCRKTKWGIVSKFPVFDSEKKIVGVIGTFVDITERKKSEDNFKFIEQCLNSTSQIIIIADGTNNRFVYISKKSFETISGYSVDYIYETGNAETTLKAICYPEDIHKFSVVVNWPETHTFEWRMICSDKSIKWIRTTVSQIQNDTSEDLHLIWTCVDISEEKEIETQRVNYSKYLQRELISFSPKILWTAKIAKVTKPQFYALNNIHDRLSKLEDIQLYKRQYVTIVDQSKYIYIKKEAFEDISDYSVDQLYKLNRQEALNLFCHPNDISKHVINIKWPKTYTFEWRMITKNNDTRRIRTTKTHITNTSNQFLYSISSSVDITDAKNNKFQGDSSHNEAIESLINLLWPYSDLKENISFIHLSNEIELITGYPKSIFTQNMRPIQSIIHPSYHDKLKACLESKEPQLDLKFKIITSEGKITEIKTSAFSKEAEDGDTLYYGEAELA